jgi:uncharacterized RDD family membrane protein YckC
MFGAARREEFQLTPEEPGEFSEAADGGGWGSGSRSRSAIAPAALDLPRPRTYGGFFRRAIALLVDLGIIVGLSAIMGGLAYLGYKVGLAAHDRTLSSATVGPLIALLTSAGTFLSMAYFIVFHGMDGRTPGKWLLKLRVVGADDGRVGYRRACLRWLALVFLAPFVVSWLWVIWSREKRAWHDYLARTWVIRDEQQGRAPGGNL